MKLCRLKAKSVDLHEYGDEPGNFHGEPFSCAIQTLHACALAANPQRRRATDESDIGLQA